VKIFLDNSIGDKFEISFNENSVLSIELAVDSLEDGFDLDDCPSVGLLSFSCLSFFYPAILDFSFFLADLVPSLLFSTSKT
jgi:hypothetical protein